MSFYNKSFVWILIFLLQTYFVSIKANNDQELLYDDQVLLMDHIYEDTIPSDTNYYDFYDDIDTSKELMRQSDLVQVVPIKEKAQTYKITSDSMDQSLMTFVPVEEISEELPSYDYYEFPDYGQGGPPPPAWFGQPGPGWPSSPSSGPPPSNQNQKPPASKFKPKPSKPKPSKPGGNSKPPIGQQGGSGGGWSPEKTGPSESEPIEVEESKEKQNEKNKLSELKDKWNKFVDKFKIKDKNKPSQQQPQQPPGNGGWGNEGNNNNNGGGGWGPPSYIPVGNWGPPPGGPFFEISIG